MYLQAKNSLHTTRICSFKYVFIVFLKKNQMLKYTLFNYIKYILKPQSQHFQSSEMREPLRKKKNIKAYKSLFQI